MLQTYKEKEFKRKQKRQIQLTKWAGNAKDYRTRTYPHRPHPYQPVPLTPTKAHGSPRTKCVVIKDTCNECTLTIFTCRTSQPNYTNATTILFARNADVVLLVYTALVVPSSTHEQPKTTFPLSFDTFLVLTDFEKLDNGNDVCKTRNTVETRGLCHKELRSV